MNLLCILLMACSNPPQEKAPIFNPTGTFEFTVAPNQEFSSLYRDQTTEFAQGELRGLEFDEATTLGVTYSKATKTATIDGLKVILNENSSWVDTGWSDTAAGEWHTHSGSADFGAEPFGTLSTLIGSEYDLGESDCNITLSRNLEASFSPTGSDATLTVHQTYSFDDSASCQEALSKLQGQIYDGGVIPAFFFDWAYYQGLNLSRLDQIQSLSVAYSLVGSKVGEVPMATQTKGSEFNATRARLERNLFGTSKSFRKLATPAILSVN